MSVTANTFPGEATINQVPAGYTIQFERLLRHPIQRVWEAISMPEKLSHWLAEADVVLKKDGRFNLDFGVNNCQVKGQITRLEPPSLLEYTWDSRDSPASVVKWELFAEGDASCRLVLTHRLPVLNLSTASGWHQYLAHLLGVLDGTPIPWSEKAWEKVHDRYLLKYQPSSL